ncbi:MAG: alpha-glucan family phosphorylase [Chlorobi bacterium]|nr:alpha-glucan family phosphorylase [Chlorobiota bacterium]
MSKKNISLKPDYVFETSWEVCNKVGGIYTVLSSKAQTMMEGYGDNYIFIGPDVWKETIENPDFIEDNTLFSSWKETALKEGLRLKIGRWNIPGNPIAIIVDFTPFFTEKDKIFASFWETYKLNSISGGWDYVEPALFGYATGKVIESFYNFYLSAQDRIIAHFHEWMTGAGVLYLNDKTPQIGTVFTTHATSLGRSIAGNNMPLYRDMENMDAARMAEQLGIAAKYSLENLSAEVSDCFTTVSDITAGECKSLMTKEVDVVTPNGFTASFLPSPKTFTANRKKARAKLVQVAEAVLDQKIENDAMMVLTSGRYEFRNKGLDVFIDALGKMNQSDNNRQIVVFIAVPANHAGPRNDVQKLMGGADYAKPVSGEYLTHSLYSVAHDPVLNKISENKLGNSPNDKVKVIFVPVYLDGNDGVFNMGYYQLLPGFDVTVFPSYYEPWGYTPMESIAFKIPTLTTSLAGFGLWLQSHTDIKNKAAFVVERDDENYSEAVDRISEHLMDYASLNKDDYRKAATEAYEISKLLYWENLAGNYRKAYGIALKKVESRSELFSNKQSIQYKVYTNGTSLKPEWKKVYVKVNVPEELEPLRELSMNLWWSWNYEAEELFMSINKELWESVRHNPVVFLNGLSFEKFQDLRKDKAFLQAMEKVYTSFKKYMNEAKNKPENQIAYFSMEFGLHESIRTYSGGLGILAGDYLKQASDSNVNMVGIGLMYRHGYFSQSISLFGDQIAGTIREKFAELPIHPVYDENNEWLKIGVALPGRTLTAKVWEVKVGRISLYLLDTDNYMNSADDRTITSQLYGGDWDNRFKQELLLGVGGIRLIDALGLKPDVFHLNEGHAAFAGMERLRYLVQDNALGFDAALEVVRGTTLFTTHTPVPAGHDKFTEDVLRTYIPHYADRLDISWEDFMGLGRFNKEDHTERFSMSVLAAHCSSEINGVSKIHGRVSREMFVGLYPGYFPEELHIGYVTNGVHYPTWTSANCQRLMKENNLNIDDLRNADEKTLQKLRNIPDNMIWENRKKAKNDFVGFLKEKVSRDLKKRQEKPKVIFDTLEGIDPNALYIGFARRFATYKRAHLLFTNRERLLQIIDGSDRPVRFVFAGKAHPNDIPGQDLIKKIIHISKEPEFIGKVFFLENYNMAVAKKMIPGVDIWLNTPTRPLEASGTSGEKAVMNGVVNLSVLDGWWAEGYRKNAGWAIPEARSYGNQAFQDELDAETIYNIIEDEILPQYFDRDENGVPQGWVSFVKNTLTEVAPNFTMKRMLDDYHRKFYSKLFKLSKRVNEKHFEHAIRIAESKRIIASRWQGLEVVEMRFPDTSSEPLKLGQDFAVEVVMKTNHIPSANIGVDLLLGNKENGKVTKVYLSEELELTSSTGENAVYAGSVHLTVAGIFDFAVRIFAKIDLLNNRQDVNLVKWA